MIHKMFSPHEVTSCRVLMFGSDKVFASPHDSSVTYLAVKMSRRDCRTLIRASWCKCIMYLKVLKRLMRHWVSFLKCCVFTNRFQHETTNCCWNLYTSYFIFFNTDTLIFSTLKTSRLASALNLKRVLNTGF